MGQTVVVVDAFTGQPFTGNPAAVCVLPDAAPEPWMRSVAAEMNLSETAFVSPRPDGDHDLRWFTPTAEIDLCGHATLASAHVMGGDRTFHTRSGPLRCRTRGDGTIAMDFPAIHVEPAGDAGGWPAALGLAPDRVVGVYDNPAAWVFAEVASPADVRAVVPDLPAIMALGGYITVAAAPGDGEGVDSVCRVFAPAAGIPEDPVTGSAHCFIAPWLAARTGRDTFTGVQASPRGGVVGLRLAGDRVELSGRAVTVMEGTLRH